MVEMVFKNKHFWFSLIGLFLIVVLGIFLRVVNISPFKFYPDAYQSLIVAENISYYHSVVGQLGREGMFYPDFFMWTRPVFPILINFMGMIIPSPVMAAQFVVVFCSISSILLAYLLIIQIFKSKFLGILGGLFITISFNHVVWSGFIYTEAPAVFINLVFLNLLVWKLNKKALWWDIWDIVSGIVLGISIFTRYEYILLILPIGFLIQKQNPDPFKKIVNISLGFLVVSSIFLSQFYYLPGLFQIIIAQLSDYYLVAFVFLIILTVIFGFSRTITKKYSKLTFYFNNLVFFIIEIIAFLAILQVFFGEKIIGFYQFSAMREFFRYDFLLGLLCFGGIKFLLKDQKYKNYGYFGLITIFLLWPIYNKVNPDMQRYWTHFLPFLIIPAVYLVYKINQQKWAKVGLVLIFGLIVIQSVETMKGIRDWDNGDWFRISYEEKSANLFKEKIDLGDTKEKYLIASFPEAYYFFTGIPTHSLTADEPFLYINQSLDDKTFLIIEDMGMYELFPNFAQFLDQSLQDKKIGQYWVGETYHWSITQKKESYPVSIYEIKLVELKSRLNKK